MTLADASSPDGTAVKSIITQSKSDITLLHVVCFPFILTSVYRNFVYMIKMGIYIVILS